MAPIRVSPQSPSMILALNMFCAQTDCSDKSIIAMNIDSFFIVKMIYDWCGNTGHDCISHDHVITDR